MLSKESFVDFILKGPDENAATTSQSPVESALPDGFEGFDPADTQPATAQHTSSFARRLLEASGFGYAEMVQRESVIRSTDAVARYLPERVAFWPKTTSRSYQTLLFEAELDHKQLLSIPAFRFRKMAHLDIVEDALARLVSEALDGFQRGGETVTADVRKGRKEETLCVVSILDGREDAHNPVRHVCFGTQNRTTSGLETFQLTERTKSWDAQIARDHLGLLYERQFKKLGYRHASRLRKHLRKNNRFHNVLVVYPDEKQASLELWQGGEQLTGKLRKGQGYRDAADVVNLLSRFFVVSKSKGNCSPDLGSRMTNS